VNDRLIRRLPTRLPARQFAPSRKQSLAQVAGMLCTLPEFWKHLRVSGEQEAAAHVRAACGVRSRAELDTNAYAAELFHERVRRPFAMTRES
jgi:hypothetical protein